MAADAHPRRPAQVADRAGRHPYRTGTVFVQELQGRKVTGAEFSCSADSLLTGSFNFDAKKYDSSRRRWRPPPTPPKPFHGKQMTVKTGTFGAEAAVSGVRSMSLSWNNAIDTGTTPPGTGLKAEQIRNGVATISGSVSVDWLTTTRPRSRICGWRTRRRRWCSSGRAR